METNYNMSTVFSKKDFNFSCIYKLISPSGKIYVGQTQCLYKRFRSYRKFKCNKYLKNAFLKYGLEGIIVEILEKDVPLEKLDEREQFYFDTLQPFGDNGYNICKEAGTTRGRKRPSEEMAGSIAYLKSRVGELNHFYGKEHSEETKNYLREINIGRKHSEETKEKIKAKQDNEKKNKCVQQVDLVTKEIINVFESIKEASIATGIGMCNISQVVNKRTCRRGEKEWLIKSAGGFYWQICQ